MALGGGALLLVGLLSALYGYTSGRISLIAGIVLLALGNGPIPLIVGIVLLALGVWLFAQAFLFRAGRRAAS